MLLDRAYGAPPPSKFDRDAPLSAHDVAAMRALSAAQGEKAWVYGEITALGASDSFLPPTVGQPWERPVPGEQEWTTA